jgi:hypothetical protein
MRHGTWVETGGSGGGIGLVLAVVGGLWLAASMKPAKHVPAVEHAPAVPAVAGVSVHAAGQVTSAGHGVGWWSLAAAGLFVAGAVLTVAVLAVWEWTDRRHDRTPALDSPGEVSTVQDAPVDSTPVLDSTPAVDSAEADLSSDAAVVHLADYRRRAAGGDAA